MFYLSIVFADTQDNVLKTNTCTRTKTFKLLRSEFTDQKDTPNITKEMNDWYSMSTSFNIDRIPSVFQQKKQISSHVVSPIHNNHHFVMIDVFHPCDRIPNDQVTIYDYLYSGDKAKNLSAKMWFA